MKRNPGDAENLCCSREEVVLLLCPSHVFTCMNSASCCPRSSHVFLALVPSSNPQHPPAPGRGCLHYSLFPPSNCHQKQEKSWHSAALRPSIVQRINLRCKIRSKYQCPCTPLPTSFLSVSVSPSVSVSVSLSQCPAHKGTAFGSVCTRHPLCL